MFKDVWWYGQNRVKLTPMGDKKRTWRTIDKGEWVEHPGCGFGLPHEVIDAASENLARAHRPHKASRFDYELRGMWSGARAVGCS